MQRYVGIILDFTTKDERKTHNLGTNINIPLITIIIIVCDLENFPWHPPSDIPKEHGTYHILFRKSTLIKEDWSLKGVKFYKDLSCHKLKCTFRSVHMSYKGAIAA